MDQQVQIQLQDIMGNWRTYNITLNNSQMILSEMTQLANQFPGQRVRAVDMNGKIVDIL
jgi:formamidopyrimidine-DNA glycosylase